jgi:hypothetical protein
MHATTGTKRERLRSRFRVGLLACGLVLLPGCGNHFGPGVAGLAASDGWQPLPVGSWVLNDGFNVEAMVFCPRAACAQQGFAALLTLEGREAEALERQLGGDPARLARDFAKRPAPTKTKAKPAPHPKTTTTVARFVTSDASGLLVEIGADATGKRAATAILFAREDGRLRLALAVSADADRARAEAAATWRSR